MAKNVYIHIPFCKSKCNYCTFVSFNQLELKDAYFEALKKQIDAEYMGEKVETLYFGGGTPSVLSVKEFETLISLFNIDKNCEITTEINPEGIDKSYLEGLKKAGINRISIGSQSFDDGVLKLIGRRHDSNQIKEAVRLAHEAGFDNISLDLIYGLPTQNIQGFRDDLISAVDLGIQHISLYGLKIEEGCNFHSNIPKELPDLDAQADMYLLSIETLKKNGFEHYEISNFGLKNFHSKHNLNYWNNNSYYGFGVSSSGYINQIRYTNEIDLAKYIQNPLFKIDEQKLSIDEIEEEEIFLGLRKASGIDVNAINEKFGIDFENKYQIILNKYLETGHISKTQSGYNLSDDGILVSNEILSEFIA